MERPADHQAVLDYFTRLPGQYGVVLPPTPATGLCGYCGQPAGVGAPRGTYDVAGTPLCVDVLLCPDHREAG